MNRKQLDELGNEAELYVVCEGFFVKKCQKKDLIFHKLNKYINIKTNNRLYEIYSYHLNYKEAKQVCDYCNKRN